MTVHVPILLQPITEALVEPFRALPEGASAHAIVDCTLGGGGHTAGFLEAFAANPRISKHRVIALDQDETALARAQCRFEREIAEGRLVLFRSRFSNLDEVAKRAGVPVLGILADLGFSSDQLEDASRGLSFSREGPIDMRLDPSQGWSAREFLLRAGEKEIEAVIHDLGEERFAKRIAGAIVRARRERHLPDTTTGLAELISRAVPPPARHGRIHPATRTFQALRIHVNDEMKELDELLARAILLLNTGGRLAILSFHSLEDRKVKLAFRGRDEGASAYFRPLMKKPVEPSEDEVRANPRARSAKLRIAEKIALDGEGK